MAGLEKIGMNVMCQSPISTTGNECRVETPRVEDNCNDPGKR